MFPRKYRMHAILILSALAILIVPQITNKPDKDKTAASVAAATEFLQIVDAGRYPDSWQITAAYLQKTISLSDWEKKLAEIRTTFGPLSERQLENVSFTAPAEELPEQEIILLEYAATFKLKEMKEVVTVIHDTDNQWRVVGYFIQ